MSDDEPKEATPPGEPGEQEPTPDPSELDDLLNALLGEGGLDVAEPEPEQDKKLGRNPASQPQIYNKIADIPEDFLTFLIERDKKWAKREKWKGVIRTIYENPDLSTTQVAKLYDINSSTVSRIVEKYRAMWNQYLEDYHAWKKRIEGTDDEEEGEVPEPAPAPAPTHEPEPAPRARGGSRRPRKADDGDDEKIPTSLYQLSGKTTTFKEIDKALSELLGAQFHDSAIRKEVYARLGELLIFSLLQLGVVERDKIVQYSEQLSTDPSKLYEYVKNQLDAVLRLTDAEALKRVWVELTTLRRQVRALDATADMLAETLKEYEDALQFLMGMLTEDQLEKLAAYVFMKEYMKQFVAPPQGASAGGGR